LRSIGDQMGKVGFLVRWHGEDGVHRQRPIVCVFDRDAAFADTSLQQRPLGKVAVERHARYVDDGLSGSLLQALRGRTTVGADEAADAKFDAAEPTRNHDDRTIETLPVDGGQDGFAGTAGWLAVVIEAVGLTDAVCPAMMTAAVAAQAVDKRHGGFRRACWRRLREEAALLDFDCVRAGRSQGGE